MKKLTNEIMLKAMQGCDPTYDGKFWVGVRTTGIYCLPSCKAKLPLKKNVVFFRTRDEAVGEGLRGCKRCKSATFPNITPDWLNDVLNFMKKEITTKIDENILVDIAKVDISTIRRYFKTHYQVTPIAFHRKLRLEYAKKMIDEGIDYLTTGYKCGFESASGFRDAFVKEFGLPPGQYYANKSDDKPKG